VVLLLAAAAGCRIAWKDRNLLEFEPVADMWIHHPEGGSTNWPRP
jgi:hypothetical protein